MSITFKRGKQNGDTTYVGAWSGLSDPIAPAQLSGASLVNETETVKTAPIIKATGDFGNAGTMATSAFVPLQSGTHFAYDKRLDASTTEDATDGYSSEAGGITDTGASGALAANKYIRVVTDSKNVKDGTGLNLKVYAKQLSSTLSNNASPPSDRIYVDPASGRFILPRPVYWNKMENLSNFTTPEIGVYNGGVIYDNAIERIFTGQKFGNGLRIYSGGRNTSQIFQYKPVANANLSKFTMSFWMMEDVTCGYYEIDFNIGPAIFTLWGYSGITYYTRFLFGGVEEMITHSFVAGLHHYYVVIDQSIGLSGGKSAKLYRDGTLLHSSSRMPNTGSSQDMTIGHSSTENGYYGYTYMDNLKIWLDVIDDPSFEYNSGTGREDAMHVIYGSANSYKPATTTTGYYRAGASGSFMKINL